MRQLVGALAVFACGALLRVPAFTRGLLSDDEAIYAATAEAMNRGLLLYRDVVDHKPPAIYHLYQLGAAALGAGHAQGAHLLVLLAVLATGWLLARVARRPGGPQALPLLAAGLFLVFSTTWHDYDALAANCELFLLLPQTGAALLLLRSLKGRHFWAGQLAVGLLVGISALCKYQGLTFLGVSAGLLAWAVFRRQLGWSRATLALALQVVAAMAPAAGYLAVAAWRGNAGAAIDWFRFNFSYVGAGLEGLLAVRRALWRLSLIGGTAIAVYGLGLWGAARVLRGSWMALRSAPRAQGQSDSPDSSDLPDSLGSPDLRDRLAVLWLATSLVAWSAGGRFFGHYFHLLLPPLCLLAAPRFLELWRRGRLWRAVLAALVAVPALAFFLLATAARPLAESWDHRDPPYDVVANRIVALTAPTDPVFVWGNSPQLYVLAGRPLGSRFTFCNYMTGESPGTPTETGAWDAERSSLPAAWDMLLEDLDRRRPVLFVDAAAAGWDGYDKFPVRRYPRLQAYLAAHYQRLEAVAGVVLYRRRT